MEKVLRGYIFRLYPSNKQIELIEKNFGCYRYIYNYFLDKNKNYINSFGSIKELPFLCKEHEWLKEVDSCLLRYSIFNLEDSFKRYKNKRIQKFKKYKWKNNKCNSI